MWDVKMDLFDWIDIIKKFYLNYVGCKAVIALACIFGADSFTLTMWDVKFRGVRSFAVETASFTLTMWDVKYLP